MKCISIGDRKIGDEFPAYIIAEIGINHNGDINIAKQLIDTAVNAGCDAVKFQKRSVDVVYSKEELARPRENPFGSTNGELKRGLEFGTEEYSEIDKYCKKKGIQWFASCWDEASVDFIDQFDVPAYKIASASLTDDELLKYTKAKGKTIILSTGMSTLQEIDHAVEILGKDNLILLHTVSTYPAKYEDINLKAMKTLKDRYDDIPVGYSGHETGIATSSAAVAMGACVIERHITLDRAMWGSDQAASLEPNGLNRLVRDIRLIETAFGSPEIRCLEIEEPVKKKLRRK
ncbi:N-acetylneuraminate synthase family protein [Clostridium neuense]|uniref:N-acetylneuraminate synthase family protein n=1 Tax=Clostridium neuense TaxID=1728934 RepID=A0ABW8TGJ8_9CLOT